MACTVDGGIGLKGKLPWRIKDDIQLFKEITTHAAPNKMNAVIMGRKTWESIPEKFRPLQNRYNIICSSTMTQAVSNNTIVVNSPKEVMNVLSTLPNLGKAFVVGGASIYKIFFDMDVITQIHLSFVYQNYECDTFFDISDILLKKKVDISKILAFNDFCYLRFC